MVDYGSGRSEEERTNLAKRLIDAAVAPGIIEFAAERNFSPTYNCQRDYPGYDPGRISSQIIDLSSGKGKVWKQC